MVKELSREEKKEIDKNYQEENGCGKGLLKENLDILCGDATYKQDSELNKIRAFCNDCRNKFQKQNKKRTGVEDNGN